MSGGISVAAVHKISEESIRNAIARHCASMGMSVTADDVSFALSRTGPFDAEGPSLREVAVTTRTQGRPLGSPSGLTIAPIDVAAILTPFFKSTLGADVSPERVEFKVSPAARVGLTVQQAALRYASVTTVTSIA